MIAAIRASALIVALAMTPHLAWAEGAWVLWVKTTVVDPESSDIRSPELVAAFASEDECVRGIAVQTADAERLLRGAYKRVVSSDGKVTAFFEGIRGGLAWSYLCLPDTIDPRAPMGGSR